MSVAAVWRLPLSCNASGGAPGRIRTCDTRFRKPVLYPLSYEGDHARLLCRG
jgi:hypothetical protein